VSHLTAVLKEVSIYLPLLLLPAKLAPSVPFVYSMVWCLSGSFIESFLFINLSFATSRFISNLYPYGLL